MNKYTVDSFDCLKPWRRDVNRIKKPSFALLALLIVPLVLPAVNLEAQQTPFRVAQIFGDNMVLQRDAEIPIWGWANPGDEISVELDGHSSGTMADGSGKWMARFHPMQVGEPFSITISGPQSKVVLENVVVGEVWICSGQSNMEWAVSGAANANEEIAAANFPSIRQVKINHQIDTQPTSDAPNSGWKVCSSENTGDFTAVGYYFGRMLHDELKVPIGLVNSSWGGTIVEAWTSGDSLISHPDFRKNIQALRDREPSAQAQSPSDADAKTVFDGPNNPTALYNGMIHPLVPFAVRGAIWYQGESNADRAEQYRSLFPLLIKDWRAKWESEMPFYWVQLANFQQTVDTPQASDWAELREAQSMALKLPSTGEAVIIDIGDARDIHPRNKQDVGKRLALIALAKDYGKKVEFSGPRFREMKIVDDQIRLSFEHADGIKSSDGNKLSQFAIAGDDRKFVWAVASIEGDTVVVSSAEVPEPVAVRYAWADNPEGCNLTNSSGLAASPFRTDTWDE